MATATLKARLTLSDSLFQAGIKRASAAVTKFGSTVAGIAKSKITLLTSALSGAAVVRATRGIINLGDELLRMKRITGISVESLFILREAFTQAGNSAESIGPSVGRMQKNLFGAAKGGGTLRATIEGMGIDFTKLLKMRPDEQFLLLGKAIDGLPDLRKQAAAMEIFGKAGLGLLPVFAELKDFDSKGLEQQAKFMGKNAEAFDNANDAIQRMKTLASGLFGGMAVMIAPLLERLAKAFSGVDWIAAGDRIATSVSKIVKTGMGLLSHPELVWDAFVDAAKFAITRIGPVLLDGLLRAVVWFGKAFGQVLGKTIVIAGEMLVAIALGMGGALVDSFMTAVAYLHAGLAFAAQNFVAMLGSGFNEIWARAGAMLMWMRGASDDEQLAYMNKVRSEPNAKGISWKDQLKKSKDTFVTGGIGARGMDAGTQMMAKAMNDLKTMFKGGGLARARRAGEDEFGINENDKFPAKAADTYGTGNWRKTRGFGTLRGASMAGGLNSSIFSGGRDAIGSYSSLRGGSLIGAGQGGGAHLRSSGMIWAKEKRRQEAKEKAEAKGIDKTNDILGDIKGLLENGME